METNTASVLTVVLAAVTIIGNAVSAVISRLSAQDKLKYDQKLITLELSHEQCMKDHAESKDEIKQLNARIDSLTGLHPALPASVTVTEIKTNPQPR